MLVAPTPRFAIGDTIWSPGIRSARTKLACPDCFGSGKWRVETPAGSVLETPCLRCADGFRQNDEIPSLYYQSWEPYATRHTVSGVETSGHRPTDAWSKDQVNYQCFEQPSGGTIIAESRAHATEDEAMQVAKVQADEKNAVEVAKPEVLTAKRVGELRIEDARFDQFKNGLWNAFYAARRLASNIRDTLEDENISPSDLREEIEEHLKWEAGPYTDPTPIEAVVRAAEADAADGNASDRLVAAMQGIPAPMRGALLGGKVEEFA